MADYVAQTYPKWKYHASEPPVVVIDADEEASLGAEWGDSPNVSGKETYPLTDPVKVPFKKSKGDNRKGGV
jgi:hypothetical protein